MTAREERQLDLMIVRELADLNATVNAFMNTTGALVANHNIDLHGKNGDNGVCTTISKHKNYFTAIFWMVGVVFVAGVGVAVKAFT